MREKSEESDPLELSLLFSSLSLQSLKTEPLWAPLDRAANRAQAGKGAHGPRPGERTREGAPDRASVSLLSRSQPSASRPPARPGRRLCRCSRDEAQADGREARERARGDHCKALGLSQCVAISVSRLFPALCVSASLRHLRWLHTDMGHWASAWAIALSLSLSLSLSLLLFFSRSGCARLCVLFVCLSFVSLLPCLSLQLLLFPSSPTVLMHCFFRCSLPLSQFSLQTLTASASNSLTPPPLPPPYRARVCAGARSANG